MSRALAVIAGVGPGISLSVAKSFASTYDLVLISRSQNSVDNLKSQITAGLSGSSPDPKIYTFAGDVTSVSSMSDLKSQLQSLNQPVNVAIYNVSSSFVRKPFLETDPAYFETAFKGSPYGAVLFSQTLLPFLLENTGKSDKNPTIIFTGATASFKSNAQMSTFSSGKFALRAIVHSLSKEFAPQGVHVATVNIDGVVDTPRTASYLTNVKDAKMKPEHIAHIYWDVHNQPRSTWSTEFDIRPFMEKW
ncbi:hypothetical protein V1511DRAFT_491581 [Dipodascopsis uninucleata]